MKKAYTLFFITFFWGSLNVYSQTVKRYKLFREKNLHGEAVSEFTSKATSLELSKQELDYLFSVMPDKVELEIPFEGQPLILELEKHEPLAPGFHVSVSTPDGGTQWYPWNKERVLFFRGKIKGAKRSLAAISFFDNEIMGVFSDEKSNITIGNLKNNGIPSSNYVIYRDIHALGIKQPQCFTEESGKSIDHTLSQIRDNPTVTGCPVDLYIEADFDSYQKNGKNVDRTVAWVAGIINTTSIVFKNEDIDLRLKEVKVWDILDPYSTATTTNTALNLFANQIGNGFNGDLAHLFSTRSLGGGRAYLNVLCSQFSFNKTGVSGLLALDNFDFPVFSWNVYEVAHELGHNFGSPHTHSCTWPGGPIDNCAPVEDGTCSPGPSAGNFGGTIMSYCNKGPGATILSAGFGILPGNLIRSKVKNSTCLCNNCDMLKLEFILNDTSCSKNGSATVMPSGVSGPYSYFWDNGEKTQTAINLSAGWHSVTVIPQNKPECKIIQGVKIDGGGVPKPQPINYPWGKKNICTGTTVYLMGQDGAYSYQWYKNGVKIDGANGKDFAVNSAGKYSFKTVSKYNCFSVESDPVELFYKPRQPSPILTVSNTNPCKGETVNMKSSSKTGNQWFEVVNQQLNYITGATDSILQVTRGGKYGFEWWDADSACNYLTFAAELVYRTVSSPPVPLISSSGPNTFCEGNDVLLTSSSNSGNQWYNNGQAINGSTQNIFKAVQSGNYSIKVTNSDGCSSVSLPTIVSIIPVPAVPILTFTGTNKLCEGDSLVLNSTYTGVKQWIKDGNSISEANGNTYSVKKTGVYAMKVTNDLGCSSFSMNLPVTVNANPPKPIITASGLTTFCHGESLLLSSNAVSGNQWFKDGTIINGAVASSYSASNTGQYTVRITNSEGCSSTSGKVSLKVNDLPPKPVILWNGNHFNITSGYGGYKWYKDGLEIIGADSNIYKPLQNGIFKVTVKDSNNCAATSDEFNLVVTGVLDLRVGNATINCYPNPVREVIHINVSNIGFKKLRAQLYDMYGRQFMEKNLVSNRNSLNTDHLPAGIYYLLISNGKEKSVMKIAVIK